MIQSKEVELVVNAIVELDVQRGAALTLDENTELPVNLAIRAFLSESLHYMTNGLRFGFVETHAVKVARAVVGESNNGGV